MEVIIKIDLDIKDLIVLITAIVSLVTAIINLEVAKNNKKSESPSKRKGKRK